MENTFSISPMTQEFSLSPGESYTGEITVVNPSDATSDFSYSVSVVPYNVIDDEGQIDMSSVSTYSQITDWITILDPKGTLTPSETHKISFTINVPENAPAGGQYAIILVSPDSDDSDAQGISVGSVFALGSIVYADIAGESIRSGDILENNVPEFSPTTPIVVSVLVSNNGNIHETALISITATNNFTGEKIFPANVDQINSFSERILPGSTRMITHQIDNLPPIGIVKIEQTVYYGDAVSTVTKDVVLCPAWFLFMMIIVFFGLIALIVFSIRRHRRKKLAI